MVKLSRKLSTKLSRRLSIDLAVQSLVSKIYALSGFSPSSYFATPNGGGEAGAASSIGMISMIRVRGIAPAAHNRFASRVDGSHGWQQYLLTTGALIGYFTDGTGAWKQSGGIQLTASDVGRVIVFISWIDAAGVIHGATSRLGLVTTINTVITGYMPYTGPHSIGTDPGSTANASNLVDVIAHATFGGAPTDTQFQAYFDAARVLGDLPSSFAGATMRHRWSLRDQLAGVVDPAGRKTYGATGWNKPTYFETATNAGFAGSTAGFFAQARIKILSKITGSGFPFARGNAVNQGYLLQHNGTTLRVTACNGSAAFTPTDYTLLDTDMGRTAIMSLVYDQPAALLRFYLDDVQVSSVAMSAYAALANLTTRFGAYQLATSNSNQFALFQAAGGNVIPTQASLHAQVIASEAAGKLVALSGTDHLWDFDAAIQAAGGAAVTQVVDTITGATVDRASLSAGSMDVLPSIETAPPAPTQLTDTITQASPDAQGRVGSPRLVAIDTSIDGRKSYGLLGASATAALQTSGGIRGSASGFWFHQVGRLEALGATFCVLLSATLSGTDGWQLYTDSSQKLAFNVAGGSGGVTTAAAAFAAADVGQIHQLQCVYDGATVYIYLNRVMIAFGAKTGYSVTTQPFKIFGRGDNTLPATNWTWMGTQGGDGFVPTGSELQAAYDETARTGVLTAIPGKTPHQWFPTADVIANGGPDNGLPAQFLDRIGTDHLARVDIDTPKVGPNAIRGVGPYSATDLWLSAAGGGIQGATSGFHLVLDVVMSKVPSAIELLAATAPSAATSGFYLQFTAAGALRLAFNTTFSSSYQVVSGDVGVRRRVLAQFTGSVLRLYWNSATQVGADVAATFVVPPAAVAMFIGQFYGAQAFGSGEIELAQGGQGVLSGAEITALFADMTQPPPVVAGKTQKRWRFHDDTAATPTKVPRTSTERISGGDDLTRYGAGLTLAQRVEHPWSYETSPLLYGGKDFETPSTRYESAQGQGIDTLSPWWQALVWRVDSQAVSSASRALMAKRAPTVTQGGWDFLSIGTNTGFQLRIANDTGSSVALSGAVAAADVGKWMVTMLTWDGSVTRGYHKRALLATSASLAGHILGGSTSVFSLGGFNYVSNQWFGQGVTVFGAVCGAGLPTLAQYLALSDAVLANDGEVQAIPSMSDHLWSLTRSAKEASNAFPTTVLDRIGNHHITLTGAAATLAPTFARAAA